MSLLNMGSQRSLEMPEEKLYGWAADSFGDCPGTF
jgi:hypothetical protein